MPFWDAIFPTLGQKDEKIQVEIPKLEIGSWSMESRSKKIESGRPGPGNGGGQLLLTLQHLPGKPGGTEGPIY